VTRRAGVRRLALGLACAWLVSPPVRTAETLDLPDVALTDSSGRALRLRQDVIGSRVVALQFVFTRCGTVCPVMGAQFRQVQELLGDAPFRLVSVSIDPTHDTPERLAEWARLHGAGPSWLQLTGEREEIKRLLVACGLYTADAASHSPTVVVYDGQSGRFTRVSGLGPARAVADALARLARHPK
jgi:protein SCO1/2